jgi:hypothetical protein
MPNSKEGIKQGVLKRAEHEAVRAERRASVSDIHLDSPKRTLGTISRSILAGTISGFVRAVRPEHLARSRALEFHLALRKEKAKRHLAIGERQ